MAADLDQLIKLMARLPGFGPRSARRAVLYLIKKKETALAPLISALSQVSAELTTCMQCGNVDIVDPCHICKDARRNDGTVCVVEDVDDLWALERSNSWRGQYHVLGGTLSALNGVGPDDLNIQPLVMRAQAGGIAEVVMAVGATLDGQTTAHYVAGQLAGMGINITALAHGVPVGGELDYLDEGTLTQALKARRPM